MPDLQLPPSINDSRSRGFLKLVERLGTLDLVPLLVYRIDSVPASALPYLAWQFDILSPLWQMIAPAAGSIDALTDIDTLTNIDRLTEASQYGWSGENAQVGLQRELLKNAIPLHRVRGTPAAIKHALRTLGWGNVAIVEGEESWNGTRFPAEQRWAVFRVLIKLDETGRVNAEDAQIAAAAIEFFKPARAWLDSLWFVLAPCEDAGPYPRDKFDLGGIAEFEIDTAKPPDDLRLAIEVGMPLLSDEYGPISPVYNAHYRHSGITHGANQPMVADSALVLNGTAVLRGG